MPSTRSSWLAVRSELTPRRSRIALGFAFLIPLAIWSIVSYVPVVWHPMVWVTDAGDTSLAAGNRYDRELFADVNVEAIAAEQLPAVGVRANPVFLPAPHEVARGFYRAFTEPPQLTGDQWFHESIFHSLRIIFWSFLWSCILGVPIGLLCGTFTVFSKLMEPPVDFIRYMPAPAFGALMVAIFGLSDAPKVAIIFIGTFFQMVLVVAHTTRLLDRALIEAAETLGADRFQLIMNVILPGVLPKLFNDMRILLGWAWTYLIVAELVGAKSGITAYIDQQGRYFNFDLVYAAIIVIGLIGLVTDQALQLLARSLFPWEHPAARRAATGVWRGVASAPRRALSFVRGLLTARLAARLAARLEDKGELDAVTP